MAKNRTSKTIKTLLKLLSRSTNFEATSEERDVLKKSFLLFEVDDKAFAVAVEEIESVIDCPRITPLPYAPEGIIGVTSIHGKIILVMKLTKNENATAPRCRLVLLQGEAQLGLLAHRIEDVVTVRVEDLQEADTRKRSGGKTFWSATAYLENKQRRIPILSVENLADV